MDYPLKVDNNNEETLTMSYPSIICWISLHK